MSKALKRRAEYKPNDKSSKSSKMYDLNEIAKDISSLELFYDFIDGEDDIINEYLTTQDFNDFLNYFKLFHRYPSKNKFTIVFKFCKEVLMRIAGDLKEKYSLIGQNFADAFVNDYKSIICEFLKNNKSKSAIKSCIAFLTSLILQGSDVALKVAASFNIFKSSLSKNLSERKNNEEDPHTSVLNCYAAFFILDSNLISRKLCEYNDFLKLILKDLRFDKYDNVLLMIEILHEKVVKNHGISKYMKVKTFNVQMLNYLIAVYEWKGEALNFDAFTKISTVDKRCGSVHAQLHALIIDICSHNFGIAFNDNLCGLSKSNVLNKTLFKLITSDKISDFYVHSMKHEIVTTVLRNCPDLIPSFIEHLSTQMLKLVPDSRASILKVLIDLYQLLDAVMINNILTESLAYMDGIKFVEVALLLCAPKTGLCTVITTTTKTSDKCNEYFKDLIRLITSNCERVLTWIHLSELIETDKQRCQLKSEFEAKLHESLSNCGWKEDYEKMVSKEYCDKTMFTKIKKEYKYKEYDAEKVICNLTEDIDPEIQQCIDTLTIANNATENSDSNNACESFKKCLKHFLSSPFSSVNVLVAVVNTVCKAKIQVKKKQRLQLFNAMLTPEVITEYWSNPQNQEAEDIARKELIRDHIFDEIVACVDRSKSMMTVFYETVHPLRLLSVYGGTMSQCDQKILYLLFLPQIYETTSPNFDIIMFGNAVNEHYRFESTNSAKLWRPIIASQCFNQLSEERMSATINYFPIDRQSPVSQDNMIHLDQSQRSIYDPFFLLQWLKQLLVDGDTELFTDQLSVIGKTVELKVLYSKKILQFLMVCQSSNSEKIRITSRAFLEIIMERLEDTENLANESPRKLHIQTIITHLLNSMDQSNKDKRLPSVFTNIYVRMMQLLDTPKKKMYRPLMEMINTKDHFDLKYVPDFLYMVYSDKEDHRSRLLWCLQLLSDSVKCYDDFLVLVNTKVFAHLLNMFTMLEQYCKAVVLTLLKRCMACTRIAEWFLSLPGFVSWIVGTLKCKDERENRQILTEIVEDFLRALKGNKDYDELERVMKLYSE